MALERIWHQSYPPGVPAEVAIEPITMPEILAQTARDFPDKTGFIYMGKQITFGRLDGLVNRFARALAELGVKKGDRVGLVLPNIPQVIIANLAVQRLGAVSAMTNPLYTERELADQLNDAEAAVVVALDLLLPRLEKIRPQTNIRAIVACHINDFLPVPVKWLFPLVKKEMYRKIRPRQDVHLFLDLLAKHSDEPVVNQAGWDETAVLLYTGGTTGVSKGAVLTHANISSVVQQFAAWFPEIRRGDEERLLGVYPIFHSAGYSVSQNLIIYRAWSVVQPGQKLTEEELTAYCKEKLAAYKVPRAFRFVEDLPKTAIGKLMRREVKEREMTAPAPGGVIVTPG